MIHSHKFELILLTHSKTHFTRKKKKRRGLKMKQPHPRLSWTPLRKDRNANERMNTTVPKHLNRIYIHMKSSSLWQNQSIMANECSSTSYELCVFWMLVMIPRHWSPSCGNQLIDYMMQDLLVPIIMERK